MPNRKVEMKAIELPMVSADGADEMFNFLHYILVTGQYLPKVLMELHDVLADDLGINLEGGGDG